VPKQNIAKPNDKYDSKPNLPEPKVTVPKPGHGYDPEEKVYDQPKVTASKPEIVEPNNNYVPKSNIPEPKLYIPNVKPAT
jgi:hypothetical protein